MKMGGSVRFGEVKLLLMRCLLRSAGFLLRRRFCSGSVLLFGLLCLWYQILKVGRNRSGSDEVLKDTRRMTSALEALRNQVSPELDRTGSRWVLVESFRTLFFKVKLSSVFLSTVLFRFGFGSVQGLTHCVPIFRFC